MAEARIPELFGETQIRVQVLDFMGLRSCMPREAWRLPRLPSPKMLQCCQVRDVDLGLVLADVVHEGSEETASQVSWDGP